MGGKESKEFKAECASVLIAHTDTVTHCAFSPNEKWIATCGTDKKVFLWDVKKMKIIKEFALHKGAVTCCDFSANGEFLITCGRDKVLAVFDLKKMESIKRYAAHEAPVLYCVYLPGSSYEFATAAEVRGNDLLYIK